MIKFKLGARVIAKNPITHDFEKGVIIDFVRSCNLIVIDFEELDQILDCPLEEVFMINSFDYV